MTTSMLVCGKASASGSHSGALRLLSRHYTSGHTGATNGRTASRADDRAAQRELFVNVLNANATKRDAKQYLARFKSPESASSGPRSNKVLPLQNNRNAGHGQAQHRLDRSGVNLGGLYAPSRAIAESPQFTQHHLQNEESSVDLATRLHTALVCLRAPDTIDDNLLDGLAVTLSQLVKLDMKIIIVVGPRSLSMASSAQRPLSIGDQRRAFFDETDRLRKAISNYNTQGARSVVGALEVFEDTHSSSHKVEIALSKLILDPLTRGLIPIIPSMAYTPTGKLMPVSTEDVMTALTRHLSGLDNAAHDPQDVASDVDRIIVLDQIGGIPSKDRGDGAHVFVNLEQEFEDIRDELAEYSKTAQANSYEHSVYRQHQNNLDLTQKCLTLLPSASSALIITPQEAACASMYSREPTLGAGTRRQKNMLIHNLLTNKPMISPSLPVARLASPGADPKDANAVAIPTSTLVKRGMPLTIIPAVDRRRGWSAPVDGLTSLKLEDDPRIDFARLVHLIDNSFRRQLNVHDYLSRIEGRIAGVIVAGQYEGGAILTWEMPPGTNDPARLVPYLDKFAVLQSSQGSSGVADIVFQAMVRSCFPRGVCWRSRKDNPVNKWYFERAAGSWQISNSNWTIFWTGEGVVEGSQRWEDYVGVCRNVKPTWADSGKPA